jgi:hypothetical protein
MRNFLLLTTVGRGWIDRLWYRRKGPKLLKPGLRHEV